MFLQTLNNLLGTQYFVKVLFCNSRFFPFLNEWSKSVGIFITFQVFDLFSSILTVYLNQGYLNTAAVLACWHFELNGKFFPTVGKTLTLRCTAARCYILREFINTVTLMCSVAFKLQRVSKHYNGSDMIISCSLHKLPVDCPALKEKQ